MHFHYIHVFNPFYIPPACLSVYCLSVCVLLTTSDMTSVVNDACGPLDWPPRVLTSSWHLHCKSLATSGRCCSGGDGSGCAGEEEDGLEFLGDPVVQNQDP